MKTIVAILAATLAFAGGALAQTTPAPGAAPAPGPTRERCMRLPLSDVAFGIPGATEAAREKLQEYAQAEVKRRGWPAAAPLVKSNETVSCEIYLVFPVIGTEYRCLVTATFCQK